MRFIPFLMLLLVGCSHAPKSVDVDMDSCSSSVKLGEKNVAHCNLVELK